MTELYILATTWDSITEEERAPLRTQVEKIVGYPCKLAMNLYKPSEGECEEGEEDSECVEIYVMCNRRKVVTDWLELQPSGAFGIIDELYPATTKDSYLDKIETRCNSNNRTNHCEFVSSGSSSGSDSGSDSSDSDSDSDSVK